MDIEKLYQDYFLVVYKYILSISHDPLAAEEITQDTFFKALKKIDDFRGEYILRPCETTGPAVRTAGGIW